MASPAGPLDIKLNKLPFRVYATKSQGSNALEPHYKCTEVEQIRDHFPTGSEPNYSDFPVSVESIIAQDDWSKGLSPVRLQTLPNTYWRSDGVDTRYPDQAIMGPSIVALSADGTSLNGFILKFLDFNAKSYLIAGSRVHQFNGVASWATAVLDAFGTTNVMGDLSVFNNVMLACAKGTTFDATLVAPTIAPVCGRVAGATNLLAGAYQAGYTWTSPYGESAISPLPGATTLLAGDFYIGNDALGFAAGPPATATGINWYLVAAPGGTNLGFIGSSGLNGGFTLSTKTQGNTVGAPTPATTYDNAGAGGVGRLLDSGKTTWAANQWANRLVSAGGQLNVVASNTGGVLTMKYPWTIIPTGGSAYAIDTYCAYWWTTDGTTWVQVDPRSAAGTDAAKADFFTTVRFQVWKALQPNKIYSCTDPTSLTTWQSTATQIGDQSHKITSLVGFILDLAIGKEDGLWSLDRNGNDYPVLPELASQAAAGNCSPMKQWRSGLLFRVKNGLYRYEGSRLESIGLDRYRAMLGPGRSLSLADLAPYTNEVFALFQGISGATYRAYLASLRSQPYWHWNVIAVDGGHTRPIGSLAVLANAFAGGPTLFYGASQAGSPQQFFSMYSRLPVGTDNPLDDLNYRYAGADNGSSGSPSFVTTELSPLPDQDKTWTKVAIHLLSAGTLGGTQTGLALEYAVDGDIDATPNSPAWTAMQGPQGQAAQTDLYQEWFFANTRGVVGRSIQFRVTLPGTPTTGTYVLKTLVVHYKHRAQSRRRWEIELICERSTAGARFYLDARSGNTQIIELLALRDLRQPIDFEDRLGKTWPVFVEKVDYSPLEFVAGDDMDRWIGKVTLLEAPGTARPPVPSQEPI